MSDKSVNEVIYISSDEAMELLDSYMSFSSPVYATITPYDRDINREIRVPWSQDSPLPSIPEEDDLECFIDISQ